MLISIFDDVVPVDDLYAFSGFMDYFNNTGCVSPHDAVELTERRDGQLWQDRAFMRLLKKDPRAVETNRVIRVVGLQTIATLKNYLHVDDKLMQLLEQMANAQEQDPSPEGHECAICDSDLQLRVTGITSVHSLVRDHIVDKKKCLGHNTITKRATPAARMLICLCGRCYVPAEVLEYRQHRRSLVCIASRPILRLIVESVEEETLFTVRRG